ncbi:hypothetical protein L211DRAFT_844087, partial [Terfezia boudieri ATCC MYA-4762]
SDDPALLYIRTYPVSSFWALRAISTRTRMCAQLGPSLVIVISLAPILPCSDNIAMVTSSPLTLRYLYLTIYVVISEEGY